MRFLHDVHFQQHAIHLLHDSCVWPPILCNFLFFESLSNFHTLRLRSTLSPPPRDYHFTSVRQPIRQLSGSLLVLWYTSSFSCVTLEHMSNERCYTVPDAFNRLDFRGLQGTISEELAEAYWTSTYFREQLPKNFTNLLFTWQVDANHFLPEILISSFTSQTTQTPRPSSLAQIAFISQHGITNLLDDSIQAWRPYFMHLLPRKRCQ